MCSVGLLKIKDLRGEKILPASELFCQWSEINYKVTRGVILVRSECLGIVLLWEDASKSKPS